jgi:hypothetical protein
VVNKEEEEGEERREKNKNKKKTPQKCTKQNEAKLKAFAVL